MELKPSQEMFVQSYLKNNAHGTKAYLDIHPDIKEASARVNASRLLANISIRTRILEQLEEHGLGFKEVVKKLAEFLNAKRCFVNHKGEKEYVDNRALQLQGLTLILRLYDSLIKSGVHLSLTTDELSKIEQMVNEHGTP